MRAKALFVMLSEFLFQAHRGVGTLCPRVCESQHPAAAAQKLRDRIMSVDKSPPANTSSALEYLQMPHINENR